MAQLLPIVRKFLPYRMVDGLLKVCVLLNLAQMVVTQSGVTDVLPRRGRGLNSRSEEPHSRFSGGPAWNAWQSFAEYPN